MTVKENEIKLLDRATRDELSACVQLLAESVVLHRAKLDFVTLDASVNKLLDSDEDTGLYVQSKQVLEEALEVVRTRAAQSVLEEAAPVEARAQMRVNVSTAVKVFLKDEATPLDANLQNISWGGAALSFNEYVEEGDSLRLILPRPQGGSISIDSRVLRAWRQQSSRGISVRFLSLNTRDEAKLEAVLQHMARCAEDAGERGSARLVQRLDIEFDGVHELRSTLNDISTGGLGLTVPNPMLVGQSLQIVISTLDAEGCHLKLRARVVHQKPIKTVSGELYRIGLKFEHPSGELKKRIEDLMQRMVATKKP